MRHKWLQPLTFQAVTADSWQPILDRYQKGPARLEGYPSEHEFGDDIETLYAVHRWTRSRKLTCRVSKKMVSVLASTAFDDLYVKDIYLPDGVDCFQLVVEQDDPLIKDNVIFIRPEDIEFEDLLVARPALFRSRYFILAGTGSDLRGIMDVNPSQLIAEAIQLFHDPAVHPVNPRYLSIIAAVGFLADSDHQTFYRHCVLKKDELKYQDATSRGDSQTMRLLEDRAIRRGKNERLFDTFSIEIGESDPLENSGSASHGGSKRPHLRRGHFRAIRHGEGKRSVRMQWIPPVIVRRDLLTGD